MLGALALPWLLLASTACPAGEPLAGGQHTRLATQTGPIHLWCPNDSRLRSLVLYVHGYGDDVDSAFAKHHLGSQFAQSGVDALFIAVAGPADAHRPVVFADLDALLGEVERWLGAPLPGPTLLIGHSGGYRTLKAWLASPRAQAMVLLDGFYGDARAFEHWLANSPQATLRLVGQATWTKAESWRARLPAAQHFQVRAERALCTHMEIVTRGEWLPQVIREQFARRPVAPVGEVDCGVVGQVRLCTEPDRRTRR